MPSHQISRLFELDPQGIRKAKHNHLPSRLFKLDPQAIRKAKHPYPLNGPALGTQIDPNEILDTLVSCNYVAVSHVWGEKPPSFPMAGIPWKVPVSTEEKLLFILQSCHKRGYEYIWLDVLCIDQTGNDIAKKEREGEMGQMHQYYKDAHTTLVFGMDWRNFAFNWKKVDDAIREWDGDNEKVIDPNWGALDYIDKVVNDAWFHRVWTLQEAVIPLTTSPHDKRPPLSTNIKPPLYYPARLLTSDGTPMDIRGLCDLIGWTYAALGKFKDPVSSIYPWIQPGDGVVNKNGWEHSALTLTYAIGLGAFSLHPLQAMTMLKVRTSSHEIDRLRGVYALVDPIWHVKNDNLEAAWVETTKIYIERKEAALLLAMAVQKSPQGTWAAGGSDKDAFGSHVPTPERWEIISADIKEGRSLHLTVAGVTKITFPTSQSPYDDGSGELCKIIDDLYHLQDNHDLTPIYALFKKVIRRSGVAPDLSDVELDSRLNLDFLATKIDECGFGNALSSGLREIFSGWHRWLIKVEHPQSTRPKVFLAWMPFEEKEELGSYSLLWICHGRNHRAIIGKETPDPKRFLKVGIAFVDENAPGVEVPVVIV